MCHTVAFVADAADIGPAMLVDELPSKAVLHDKRPTCQFDSTNQRGHECVRVFTS